MTEESKSPALGFSIQIQIDAARQIVAQTHVDRDDDISAINDLFDKIMTATDRQAARYKIEELRKTLSEHDEGYARLIQNLEMVDAQAQAQWDNGKRRGPVQLSLKEKADRANAEANVKHWQAVRDRYAREIEDCMRKLDPPAVKGVKKDAA